MFEEVKVPLTFTLLCLATPCDLIVGFSPSIIVFFMNVGRVTIGVAFRIENDPEAFPV